MRAFPPAAALLFAALELTADTATEKLAEIRRLSLDATQCYRVRDLFLEREDFKFYFSDGYLIFSRPVGGRALAALFIADSANDEGELILMPPTRRERHSLNRFTSQPVLNEKFRQAMMFFTDDTAAVLRAGLATNEFNKADPEAGERLANHWSPVLEGMIPNVETRLLLDTFTPLDPRSGFFGATLAGGPLGQFDVLVDPRRPEQIHIGQTVWREKRQYYETWCRFQGRSFRQGHQQPISADGWLEDYRIISRLSADLDMETVAAATFRTKGSDERMFFFEISERLHVSKVLIDGEAVEFIQFDQPVSNEVGRRQNSLVAVVLPTRPEPGSSYKIEFHYQGRIIAKTGDGVYYVGNRGNWYPRRRATFTWFHLVFHYPQELDLVATGRLVEQSTHEGVTTSRFHTDSPILQAGFNLGRYKKASRNVGPYRLQVCANQQTDQQHTLPSAIAVTEPSLVQRGRRTPSSTPSTSVLAKLARPEFVRPVDRLEDVADDSAAALTFFAERFGPPVSPNIVISPIPTPFSQGFAGLVYASTLSYFRQEDPPLAGLPVSERVFHAELVRPHELAHQWWGNLLTAENSADGWMIEALATYSSLMFLEHRTGQDALNRVLEEFKAHLLSKNDARATTESAGAIVLGPRLSSSHTPNARRIIVYEKGAWILHMLRSMVGDEQFLRLLRDIATSYKLDRISTDDFRREAARFVPPGSSDPELEDFFDQWVYSIGIPTLKLTYRVRKKRPGTILSGEIHQQNVPAYFSVPVPLRIQTSSGQTLVHTVETMGEVTPFEVVLDSKPAQVTLDPDQTLLAVKK